MVPNAAFCCIQKIQKIQNKKFEIRIDFSDVQQFAIKNNHFNFSCLFPIRLRLQMHHQIRLFLCRKWYCPRIDTKFKYGDTERDYSICRNQDPSNAKDKRISDGMFRKRNYRLPKSGIPTVDIFFYFMAYTLQQIIVRRYSGLCFS